MIFYKKLEHIQKKQNTLLCIGLDSNIDKLPESVRKTKTPQFLFNKAIIDATHDLVCAYKPNSAFYEARGTQGIAELKMTCDYIRAQYSDIPIIFDAKRADIGNTNERYVSFAFDWLGADAITLHPYLGREAIQPFLDRKDKACFILCRTSNVGAGEFQDLKVGKKLLYEIVAKHVVDTWNVNGNCGLVVGATYPAQLAGVRRIAKDLPFLIPGIGAQGGDIKQTVKNGLDRHGRGVIINAARNIIFASSGHDYAQKALEETMRMRDEINAYR
jgi:orotidine-5'-phosphate decarboxylase